MIRKFIEYLSVERRYSERTTSEYERDLHEFCSFLNVPSEELNPAAVDVNDVRMWIVKMLESGLSPRSVKRKLSALRSFYKFLLRIGKVDKDITRAVVAPKVDKPLPVFFRESEVKEALSAIDHADDFESFRNCLILEMLYETGMRRAEMLGLNDADIDLSANQVRIFGKRRKERIVPFGDNLANYIRTYLAYRQEEFGIPSSPSSSATLPQSFSAASPQPFFVSNKGERLTKGTLYNIVRARMGEVTTLKKHSPHVWRHTFATDMLNNGADINSIKTLLGHASLAATQVYTHTTFDQIRDAYKKAHPRSRS